MMKIIGFGTRHGKADTKFNITTTRRGTTMNLDYDRYDQPGYQEMYEDRTSDEERYLMELDAMACGESPQEECKDGVRNIIEALYLTGDVSELENALYHLCRTLNMDFVQGTPKIQAKPVRWEEQTQVRRY